jgi:multiple sugar transport system permease protein
MEARKVAGRRRLSPKATRRLVRELVLNTVGIVVVGIIIFPIYWALCVAFHYDPDPLIKAPSLVPWHLVLTNFHLAWKTVGGNIVTSLIVSCAVVVIGLVLGVPAAYGLRRFPIRYTGAVVAVLLVTQMVPSISLSIAFYSLFKHADLLNSYLGLILADSTYAVPLMVLLLRAFLGSVPDEIMESARVDGCNELRCMWSIVVPIAVPGIITAALFGFLGAWGDFLFGLTLNSGGSVEPLTVGLYKFVGSYSTSWGPLMAAVILAAIPAGVVLAVAQRWIRGGLRAGALKG